jgi:hypothetical protein
VGVPRLIVCLIATGAIGALSAAPAWALSPSNANFTFQVGSTVNPGNTPDAVIAKAILVWKPGASNVGAACCTNQIFDSTDSLIGETTANRFPFTWNSDDVLVDRIDSFDSRGFYVGSAFTNANSFVSIFGVVPESMGTPTGIWKTQPTANALGGSVMYSTAKGASMSLTANVRTLGWVTTVGPTHGSARIFVDGKPVATISTHAATVGYRRIKFVRAWFTGPEDPAHTITIVNAGTAGHSRVDVDGFLNVSED